MSSIKATACCPLPQQDTFEDIRFFNLYPKIKKVKNRYAIGFKNENNINLEKLAAMLKEKKIKIWR